MVHVWSTNAAGFFNLGGYKEGCADGAVSGWDGAMARADRLVEIGEELAGLKARYTPNDLSARWHERKSLPKYGAYYHRRCLSIVRKAERLVDEVIRIKRGE